MLVLWYHSVTGRQVKKKGMKRMTKLSKSISVAEMMHMRENEHLSNQDIAKRLGISSKTVYAYIGKQPAGMRKPWGSNRKKDELPALTEKTEVPEMPHESFKERCERMANELHCNPTHWVPDACAPTIAEILAVCEERRPSMIDEAIPASKDRINEAVKSVVEGFEHYNNMVAHSQPESEKETEPVVHKSSNHIPELIAIFGSEAVITWLRVSLYDMGIPDCRPMNRQKMLETLKLMNDGGTSV